MHSRHHADKRQQTTSQKSLKASRPKILSSTKYVSGTSFSPWKRRRRERCLTRCVDEGDYQRRSWLFHGSKAAEDCGGRIWWSCHCVFRKRRETLRLNPGSKRCESGGAGIFTARLSTEGDYRQRWHVTRLTASSHVGFEGSPSLAGLRLRLTQLWLHKDNGWQTSRPCTNNKAVE